VSFRLALAQMLVVGGQPERILVRAAALVAEAARGGAALVLLPADASETHARAGPQGATSRRLDRHAGNR
jgi:hypothetical protein